ncbi:hypothetical protein ACP3S7_09595 [Phytobacter ursingii]
MSRGYFIINNSDVTGGIRAIVGIKFKAQAPPPEGRKPATEPGWRRRRLIRATEDERVAPVSGRATGEGGTSYETRMAARAPDPGYG